MPNSAVSSDPINIIGNSVTGNVSVNLPETGTDYEDLEKFLREAFLKNNKKVVDIIKEMKKGGIKKDPGINLFDYLYNKLFNFERLYIKGNGTIINPLTSQKQELPNTDQKSNEIFENSELDNDTGGHNGPPPTSGYLEGKFEPQNHEDSKFPLKPPFDIKIKPYIPAEKGGGKKKPPEEEPVSSGEEEEDKFDFLERWPRDFGNMFGTYIPSYARTAPAPRIIPPPRKEDLLLTLWDSKTYTFQEYVEDLEQISTEIGTINFTYSYDENQAPVLEIGDIVSNMLYIGNVELGKFSQSGGFNLTNIAYLGYYPGSSGEYYLEGGRFDSSQLQVGVYGEGVFTQTGGNKNTIPMPEGVYANALYLGAGNTGKGTYNLYNGYLCTTDTIVGYCRGKGTFNQTGGIHEAQYLNIGYHTYDSAYMNDYFDFPYDDNTYTYYLIVHYINDIPIAYGVYNMSGGDLFTYDINLGVAGGKGDFIQTGGDVKSYAWMSFGYNGGTGRYFQEKGNLTTNTFHLGINGGTGVFKQTGGTHTSNRMYFGYNGGKGYYRIYDGADLMTTDINIGDLNGYGEFSHLGGNVSSSWMTVGIAGGEGLYVMGGEQFQSAVRDYVKDPAKESFINAGGEIKELDGIDANLNGVDVYIGHTATGYFFQNFGTVSIDNLLHVGYRGTGKYFLNGGTLNTFSTIVGDEGYGRFVQTGGTHNIRTQWGEGILFVGNYGGYGEYFLSGGTLDADYVDVAVYNSFCNFWQYGGNIITTGLNVAQGTNSSGEFFLFRGGIEAYGESIGSGVNSYGVLHQYSGENNINTSLRLAESAKSFARYDLHGGSLNVGEGGADIYGRRGIELGVYGEAYLNQYGGQIDVTGDFKIALNTGSTGTFEISGGTANIWGNLTSGSGLSKLIYDGGALNVTGNINVKEQYFGFNSTASFAQDHGTNTNDNFYLGYDAQGTYELKNNAVLKTEFPGGNRDTHLIDFQKGMQYIGYFGTGNFNQSGNSSNSVFELTLGYTPGSTGNYTQTGNSVLNAVYEVIGRYGTGNFTQESGSNTTHRFYLGHESNSTGNYALSGGSLTADLELIGVYGTGNFFQTGGTNTTPALSLATNTGTSIGTYTLSGGTLNTIPGSTTVGEYGTGTFTQNKLNPDIDSVHNTTTLNVGLNNGSYGTYNMFGGTLSATTANIGKNAGSTGVFNQSGGEFIVSSLNMASTSNSSAVYNMSGGLLKITKLGLGIYGSAEFVQTGGTNRISNLLNIGYNANSNGAYLLQSGSLSAPEIIAGNYGNCSLVQTGGEMDITGSITLAKYAGSTGTFEISGGTANIGGNLTSGSGLSKLIYDGGTLNVTGYINVKEQYFGFNQTASFTQDYCTNTATNLYLGYNSGITGEYILANGCYISADKEYIGFSGTGNFIQTSGINETPSLSLAVNSGTSIGTYTLSGGNLNTNFGSTIVGEYGTGIFTQNKLNHDINSIHHTTNLTVGLNNGSYGIYNLVGGTLNALTTYIGKNSGSTGIFNHSGGEFTSVDIYIGKESGAQGIYNLSGGSFSAITEYIGYSGSGIFNQSGGTKTIDNLILGYNDVEGCSGKYLLSGGTLNVAQQTYVGKSGSAEFTQTGGTNTSTILNVGSSYSIYGEKVAPALYNQALGKLVAFDNKLYIYGGYAWNSTRQTNGANKMEVYDPATGIWTRLADGPETRFHSASFILDNQIYFIGGQKYQDNFSSTVLRYDPLYNSWATLKNFPVLIHSTKSAVVDGIAYTLFGTVGTNYGRPNANPYVYMYNKVTDTWTNKSTIPLTLNCAPIQTYNGEIFVFGGYYAVQYGQPALNRREVQIYNPSENTWRYGTPLPEDFYTSGYSNASYIVESAIRGDNIFLFSNIMAGSTLELNRYVYVYNMVNDVWGKVEISNISPDGKTPNLSLGFEQLNNYFYILYDLYPGAAGDTVNQVGVCRYELNDEGSTAVYTLSNGTLNSDALNIGYSSTQGNFIQTGGEMSIEGNVNLASEAESLAAYKISGGVANIGGDLTSGSGLSTLIYDGGALNVTGNINVNEQFYGFARTASFSQDHGTNTAKNLYLGYNSNITGTYTLANGTLSADKEYIGFSGTGILNQTGGTNTATDIMIGANADSAGIYSISNGSLVVSNLYVGQQGTGYLNISNSSASIVINRKIEFANNSYFSVVQGSSINLNDAGFDILSTNPANLQGLNNLTLNITGDCSLEIGGADIGADLSGFNLNFAFDKIIIGAVDPASLILMDLFDNQPGVAGAEALYVNNLILGANGTLNLNGKKVYYKNLTNDGTINYAGGALEEVPDILLESAMTTGEPVSYGYSPFSADPSSAVPEPSVMYLFIFGAGLAWFIRRKK